MKEEQDVDKATTKQVHDSMPFARVLGVEILAADRKEVVARLAWDEGRCTTGGSLHGAAIMGLADVCGGLCAFLNLPGGSTGTTTIESKTNFLRAIRSGHVTAWTAPIHVGKATIVISTDLRDDEGTLVARVTQTQAVLAA